jgi:uncharacterized protein YciI
MNTTPLRTDLVVAPGLVRSVQIDVADADSQEAISILRWSPRMHDQGYLVAAGPLMDTNGHGMTILRLPGADRLVDVERLATQDDASVASGFLTVRVQPWQVMLSA